MTDNDSIDVLVREVEPSYLLESQQIAAALDALGRRITSTPQVVTPQRLSRGRRVAVTVAVAGVLAAAAPAAAEWVSARTGWFGDPAAHTEEDDSEWLRLDSPEIEDVVRTNVEELGFALPAGVTPADVTSAVTARLAPTTERPGLMQEGGLRNMIGWDVACRWGWVWLDDRDAANRHQIAEIARSHGALPAALTVNDDELAQQIIVNCPADTK